MGKSSKEKRERRLRRQAEGNKHKGAVSKVPTQTKIIKYPESFDTFAELAQFASSSVFVIARLKSTQDGSVTITTLGTGFLAGNKRLMTCAHVVNAEGGHDDNSLYLIAQRNPPEWYKTFKKFKLGGTLYIYPENDSAVFYLPDDFYIANNGEQLRDPNRYLRLASQPRRIGTDVGILGYPLQRLAFNDDASDVNMNSIILRADKGVINTAYSDSEGNQMYEFTMSFNPGNSGGPIMDLRTGEVVAMVHGYQSIPINATVDTIPGGTVKGYDEEQKVLTTIRALYSLGLNSVNYITYQKKHGIAFN